MVEYKEENIGKWVLDSLKEHFESRKVEEATIRAGNPIKKEGKVFTNTHELIVHIKFAKE